MLVSRPRLAQSRNGTMEMRARILSMVLSLGVFFPSELSSRELPKVILDQGTGPWPVSLAEHDPVEPGEHPRLLFRKENIEALRARAETAEGQRMVARLRAQLNGTDGESMTEVLAMPEGSKRWPSGGFSLSHAAGFGLLFQLTGNPKYAALGRQCFEASMAGAPSCDGRYSLSAPGGALRAGPTLGWHALAYDLCYDGWDEGFRRRVASYIENYDGGRWCRLDQLARGERQHPGSNHWGMQIGGAAMALLALRGDPGVDAERIERLLEENREAVKINMTQGFGSAGFYAEGDGTGSMASHISFLTALQAYRNADGLDFYTPRPNGQWMMLKWFFLTALGGDPANLRASFPERGGYPHNIWARDGISGGGYFGIGFGVANDAQKAAMLWFYNRSGLNAYDGRNGFGLDAPSGYPHHSILSFLNWPVGSTAQNPGSVFPHAIRDDRWGFYAWRNRWQDANDVIISVLPVAAKGNMGAASESFLTIQYAGETMRWGSFDGPIIGPFAPDRDGSTVVRFHDGSCLAVDFSQASGADALLVMSGPGATGVDSVQVGGVDFKWRALGGRAPEPTVEGSRLVLGEQTISHDGTTLVLGQ